MQGILGKDGTEGPAHEAPLLARPLTRRDSLNTPELASIAQGYPIAHINDPEKQQSPGLKNT